MNTKFARTWMSLPHVAQNLDVGCNLLFGALDAMALEIVDEELVPPPRTAPGLGVGGIGRLPVFAQT